MELPGSEKLILDIVKSRTSRAWVVIDREGRITYANRAMTEMWDQPGTEVIGKALCDVAHGGRRQDADGKYLCALLETLDTEVEFREREMAVATPNGNPVMWCLVNTYIFRDAEGHVDHIAANYVPIDRYKVIEYNLDANDLHVIKAFSKAIGARDKYTMRHAENVSALMVGLAEHMRFSADHTALAYLVGIIHDIGKIGVPEHILNKPGRLTEDEFAVIRQHPTAGAEILSEIQGFESIVEIIRHHHERFDGRGYPDGLEKADIPLFSRMLAVCDTYDAMTSSRCYRDALGADKALQEIGRCAGQQFDPVISQAFIRFVYAHRLGLSRAEEMAQTLFAAQAADRSKSDGGDEGQ